MVGKPFTAVRTYKARPACQIVVNCGASEEIPGKSPDGEALRAGLPGQKEFFFASSRNINFGMHGVAVRAPARNFGPDRMEPLPDPKTRKKKRRSVL